ncbi:spinster family MFS transporter [Pseudomonas sp. Z18(2022)]|uniref:spinster family MFS transporter n=1 Tax=Pseudomonas sp. Z18(2022) TaxID=2983410 RepID=UPI002E81352F|nr:MFS transporter [Pseudomonas sp. Z18(2022)]
MDRASATRTTLFALLLVNFLNFFDRVIPAVVLEPIRKEFLLDDTMLGLLATAFTLVYAVAGVPIGRLTDRVRRTWLLSGGVFVWSAMTAASGAATNFTSMFLIRLGVGVGEATCAPVANSMIGDLYPAEKRSRALGVFMLGLPLGTLVAFALGGWLANHYGWRAPFYAAAVPGVLVAVFLLFRAEPVRGSQETYVVSNAPVTQPFRKVLGIRTLWWLTVSGALFNFAAYALNTFLPSLLIRYHQATVAEAGIVGAIVFGLTGLVGLLIGGPVADRLHKTFAKGRLRLGAICLIISAPLVWCGLAQPSGNLVVLTALIGGGWLLWFMYFVTVLPSVQDVVEPRLRGTAMSIFFFFQYVLGAGFGTLVTGLLSDRFATSAARAVGAPEVTEAMKALGLQTALITVVPLALFLTSLAILAASRHFLADSAKAQGLSMAHLPTNTPHPTAYRHSSLKTASNPRAEFK